MGAPGTPSPETKAWAKHPVDSSMRPGALPPQIPLGLTLQATAEFRHRGPAGRHFPSSLSLLCHWAALPERNNEGDTAVDKCVPFPWRQHPQGLCPGAAEPGGPGRCQASAWARPSATPARAAVRDGSHVARAALSSSVGSRGSELCLGFSHTAQSGPFAGAATLSSS